MKTSTCGYKQLFDQSENYHTDNPYCTGTLFSSAIDPLTQCSHVQNHNTVQENSQDRLHELQLQLEKLCFNEQDMSMEKN